MRSKNSSDKILRSVKSKGFKYIELPSVIETKPYSAAVRREF